MWQTGRLEEKFIENFAHYHLKSHPLEQWFSNFVAQKNHVGYF